MSFLEELKSKPWFPWAVGAGVIVFLFWLLIWSTPEPGPMQRPKKAGPAELIAWFFNTIEKLVTSETGHGR